MRRAGDPDARTPELSRRDNPNDDLKAFEYTDTEIGAGTSGDTYGDTKYDRTLAKAFKVVLNPAHFVIEGQRLMTMSMDAGQLNSAPKDGILLQVKEIAVHNSCGIQVEPDVDFQSIVKIPKDAIDTSPEKAPAQKAELHADRSVLRDQAVPQPRPRDHRRQFRLAGDDGSTIPVHGTILYANNLLFLLNCFKELAGIKPTFSRARQRGPDLATQVAGPVSHE